MAATAKVAVKNVTSNTIGEAAGVVVAVKNVMKNIIGIFVEENA